MTVILNVTATPMSFPGGTYGAAATVLNTAVWRFSFVPTAASTTYTGGNFHLLFSGPHGGIWLNDASLELYTDPADSLCFSQAMTWSAGQTITVTVDTRSGTRSVTIAGATTGNGTFSFATAGPYFDASQVLDVGHFTGGGPPFDFVGTISSVDDTQTVPSVSSWLGVIPTTGLKRVASSALMMSMLAAPIAPVAPPTVPALSWAPSFPDSTMRQRNSAANNSAVTPELITSGIAGVTRDAGNLNYFPANATEWTLLMAAANLGTGNPNSAWPFQETSGNAVDTISGVTLTSTLTVYQSAVPGAVRKCIRGVDGTTNSKLTNSTTAPNPSTTSTLLLAFLDTPGTPPAVRDVMLVASNTDLRYNSNGKLRLVAGASADLVNVLGAGQRWVVLQSNITAGTVKVFTDQEKFTGTFVLPNNAPFVVFGGQTAAVSGTGYAYGAEFIGAAAELSETQIKTLLETLGATIPWTPTVPPAPALSWAPSFPDSVFRAKAALPASGEVKPEATLPSVLPPGLAWAPSFPDLLVQHKRRAHQDGLSAPPFAGGKRLTVGASAIRQNILAQLAFSTPLTTFGTNLTFTAAAGTTVTTGTHNMVLCAGPFTVQTTGTLPTGLSSTTPYYVGTPSGTTLQFALSPALAKAGTFVTMADGGTGTHTLKRTVDTAPLYSTFVTVFSRGDQSTSPNQATDSAGNTYTYIPGAPRNYDAFPSSAFSVAIKFSGKGGSSHTWSASIGNIGGQQDEVTIGGLEIFDAPILQASSIVERADGSSATITSGTVTTTAKALLVAIIAGNGNVNQNHVFTFLDGFTKVPTVCAEGDVDAAGYIQIEVAVKLVDLKGTYAFRAQGTVGGGGPEGGQMALLAFQALTSDLQPFDWLYPQPEIPVRARRGQLGGSVEPIIVTAVVPPVTSWLPTFPDPIRLRQSVVRSFVADRISLDQTISWLPSFADSTTRLRTSKLGGEVAPPSDTNAGLTWLPVYPDRAVRARIAPTQLDLFVQAPVAPTPLLSWLPRFVDRTWRAQVVTNVGGAFAPEATLPNADAPPLSWLSNFPDQARRARSVINVGGAFAPEATLPNAAAPLLSWQPTFPDRLAVRLRAPLMQDFLVSSPAQVSPLSWAPSFPSNFRLRPFVQPTEVAAPVLAIPNPAAPVLSWAPIFPDSLHYAQGTPNIGLFAQPVVVIPNVTPTQNDNGMTFTVELVGEITSVVSKL